jgi:DNA repair exonuclease SbcCD ATPase subunit
MTIEINTTIEAHRQITEKAAANLKALRERVPELEQRLTALSQEQAQIEQAKMDDSHTLSHARQQDERAAQKHREALEYARYSVDTLGETEATREALTLEAQAKEAHRLYEETASSIEQREAARSARLEALRVEYEQARDELTTTHARIAEVGRIEQTALQKLGNSTYERLFAEYQEKHLSRLATAREAMAAAKIEETRFMDQALAELALWPDLQAKLQPEAAVYRDLVTAVLEAQVTYIDTMMAASQVLGSGIGRLKAMEVFYQWRDQLLITASDLAGIGTSRNDDFRELTRRRDRAFAALAEYRGKAKR